MTDKLHFVIHPCMEEWDPEWIEALRASDSVEVVVQEKLPEFSDD